jgi:hypothetical protein
VTRYTVTLPATSRSGEPHFFALEGPKEGVIAPGATVRLVFRYAPPLATAPASAAAAAVSDIESAGGASGMVSVGSWVTVDADLAITSPAPLGVGVGTVPVTTKHALRLKAFKKLG